MSDKDIGCPIKISDVGYRYQMSNICTRMSDINTLMSDIDIGRPIYILDVRYRFHKYWCHSVSNSAPYNIASCRTFWIVHVDHLIINPDWSVYVR